MTAMAKSSRTRVGRRTVKAGAGHAMKRGVTGQKASEIGESSGWELAQTLTDLAYQQLEEEITTLRIPPGAIVSEALLSKRFRVGRTPVREALQRLAREGLVVIMPRRGVVVSEIDVAAQLRLLEVRRELERLMVRGAAQRASNTQCKRFQEIASGMEQAATRTDDLAFMQLDREFNLLLLEACGNEFGAATLGLLHGLSRRFWYAHYRRAADLPRTARLHAAVARAVAGEDERAAAAASDELIDYIQEFTRRTIG
jgi:DNA-binding GntR family transcriptional regulator